MPGNELLQRITADPRIFGGKPVVRGLRISVEMVLALLAAGETTEAILADYPELEADDIRACLTYAVVPILVRPSQQQVCRLPGNSRNSVDDVITAIRLATPIGILHPPLVTGRGSQC